MFYVEIAQLSVVANVLKRIFLTRLLKAVDEKLREQQTGFRKDRSYTDQIAALRIIIEQSLEWNTSLFLNCVDFEKAIDSLDLYRLRNLSRPVVATLSIGFHFFFLQLTLSCCNQ
jgi:hypothetical protein